MKGGTDYEEQGDLKNPVTQSGCSSAMRRGRDRDRYRFAQGWFYGGDLFRILACLFSLLATPLDELAKVVEVLDLKKPIW
jgi:hypothetical protein